MSPPQPPPNRMDASSLVLVIVSKAAEVPGRTSLQKLTYFSNDLLHTGISFTPHFFGPFSADVAFSSDRLVAANLVSEEIETGIFFRSGKEREWTRHTYKLTPDGRKYLTWLESKGTTPDPRLTVLIEKLRAATKLDPDPLSKLAKTHYIRAQFGSAVPTPAEVSRFAKTLGWKIPPTVARTALSQLSDLGL